MPCKRPKVFVSYSRHDENLVRPLAQLLGVAADEAVFLDVTTLKAGQRWEIEIEMAIRDCLVFVLCWCCQSAQSEFVKREVELALAADDERIPNQERQGPKRIVPVIFCDARLPGVLAEWQWIDLRERVRHACQGHENLPGSWRMYSEKFRGGIDPALFGDEKESMQPQAYDGEIESLMLARKVVRYFMRMAHSETG